MDASMSLIGSNFETPPRPIDGDDLDLLKEPQGHDRLAEPNVRHARLSIEKNALLSRGRQAAERTVEWLLRRQAKDGHWRGALEGDCILESEYIIVLAWAGKLDHPNAKKCARRIQREQLSSGGWSIYPGGPVDVSASVKAYLALKLTGCPASSSLMRRARVAIRRAGGPWAVNSFTRFYLALLGQVSYSACPAVPPEMVLLPAWFPLNLNKVSAWSRTMIVPLSLMWSFKPVRNIPVSAGVQELFNAEELGNPPSVGGGGFWGHFFRGVDGVIKYCDSIGFQPLRSRAVQACRRWMLERFEGSDGLGAIFPPIIWSIVALRAMGCEETSPEVQESWRQLHGLIETEEDGSCRVEPCRSPVWDTAITLRSLSDAAAAGICGGGEFWWKLNKSVDWLLDHELCGVGDWQEGLSSCLRPREASGWCFQYANRFYPDVDDTAMVLIAFAEWRRSMIGQADQFPDDPSAVDRLRRVDVSVRRAFDWLCAMQNSDGGWAAFDRDNNLELLCRVPFADHNAMIDPSTPDITGRVLEAMGRLGYQSDNQVVARGIEYLRSCQEQNGGWFGRWGVNYIYGTWQVLEGLRAVGVSEEDPIVQRALSWLASRQHSDGSWGESPESYADPALAGVGVATPSQTAWAIAGLVSGKEVEGAAARGVRWLIDHQLPDGDWQELEFTGTGFPKVFYLRYHFYRVYFPLMAMARWCQAEQDVFRCDALTRGMVA